MAISSWKKVDSGEHTVRLFEGAGSVWAPLRVMGGEWGIADGQLRGPYGLRFTGDGAGLVVADTGNDRVSLFALGDGSLVRQLATELSRAVDVEECEGGWLVACGASHTVEFVGGDGVGRGGRGYGEFSWPSALALVPGLGLVVREIFNYGRVQVFVSPDTVAMSAMSAVRVAWMGAVARARPCPRRHPMWGRKLLCLPSPEQE